MNKMWTNIKHFFKVLLIFLDKKIIIPITKLFLWLSEKVTKNNKGFEKLLSKKSSLVVISLFVALFLFFFVDTKSILLLETSAEVIYNQEVNAIYNEEAYVVEGLPEFVDITLIGRKSDLYLAKQLPTHEVSVDLKDLKPGTHRVSLKYKGAINTITYKLDPSIASVTIYPKVSEVRKVGIDLLNENKLNSRLVVTDVSINRKEVIIKGAEYKLNSVASVKALIDINNISNPDVGAIELNDINLVAYNEKGMVVDVEMVPSKISATVKIESPSKVVPVNVIPIGTPAFGVAISTIDSSVDNVTIYGKQSDLDKISFIPIEVDIEGLSSKKHISTHINKPSGVNYISENNITIDIEVGAEKSIEIENVPLSYKNLSSNYSAYAVNNNFVTIVLKGVEPVIKDIDASSITAYVDLKGYGLGTHEVDIEVEGVDVRVSYSSKTKKANITIKGSKN